MRDASHEYETSIIVDGIDDPVVADANAVVVSSCQPGTADRTWIGREVVDRHTHALPDSPLETAKLPRCHRKDTNLVLGTRYSRTSAHGTAVSRSSRA